MTYKSRKGGPLVEGEGKMNREVTCVSATEASCEILLIICCKVAALCQVLPCREVDQILNRLRVPGLQGAFGEAQGGGQLHPEMMTQHATRMLVGSRKRRYRKRDDAACTLRYGFPLPGQACISGNGGGDAAVPAHVNLYINIHTYNNK